MYQGIWVVCPSLESSAVYPLTKSAKVILPSIVNSGDECSKLVDAGPGPARVIQCHLQKHAPDLT